VSLVVSTNALTKRYGRVTAVEDLELAVYDGDLFGFLGPNGSGKSTTLRMLLGLVYPTSGEIEVLGRAIPREAARALPDIGSLIEGPAFYPHVSGPTNLALLAAAAGCSRHDRERLVAEALERVGLTQVGRLRYRAYSSGMKQRLGLAAATLRPRRLLILDEPTNGLDPAGSREIRDLLVELVASGTTVLLSSHLLSEIELVCTRAAIVNNGKLVAQADVDELLGPTQRVLITTPDIEAAVQAVGSMRTPRIIERVGEGLVVHLDGFDPSELNSRLVRDGVRVRGLTQERPRLEEVFLGLTEDDNDIRG
jgi:ABC-type multidrug transport system ATPase subunit